MGGRQEPRPDRPTTREGIIADLSERQRSLTGALYALPQPTIAALPGAAAGAGFSIALACTCLELGIVNRVVPDEKLMAETMALARRLAAGPSEAYRLMKANLDRGSREDLETCLGFEAEATVARAATEDHREAVRAFVEKRKPSFKGR